MTSQKLAALAVVFCLILQARSSGGRAEYVGGTIIRIPPGCDGTVDAVDPQFFVFYSKKASWRVPYEKINLVEYGEKVDRRIAAAVLTALVAPLVAPFLVLSKKRQHFLTVDYTDDEGHEQAMIFKVNKDDIRATLVVLEARTGRKVEYQDDDARKSGKG